MLNVQKNIREREKDTQIKIQKTYVNKSEFADENILFFFCHGIVSQAARNINMILFCSVTEEKGNIWNYLHDLIS